MIRRLIWLALFVYVLTAFCALVWVVVPEGQRVGPVLLWCIGVLALVAVFTLPGHVAQHEPPAVDDRPPASAARRAHPTNGERWLDAELAARRTRLDKDNE